MIPKVMSKVIDVVGDDDDSHQKGEQKEATPAVKRKRVTASLLNLLMAAL